MERYTHRPQTHRWTRLRTNCKARMACNERTNAIKRCSNITPDTDHKDREAGVHLRTRRSIRHRPSLLLPDRPTEPPAPWLTDRAPSPLLPDRPSPLLPDRPSLLLPDRPSLLVPGTRGGEPGLRGTSRDRVKSKITRLAILLNNTVLTKRHENASIVTLKSHLFYLWSRVPPRRPIAR